MKSSIVKNEEVREFKDAEIAFDWKLGSPGYGKK
jgi:hypothetical protein